MGRFDQGQQARISVMIMLCILPLTSCCPKREKSCYDGFQEEGKLGAAWFPLQKLLLMHHGSFKVLSASLKLYTQYNTSLLINSPHYICNDAAFLLCITIKIELDV